MDHRTPPPTFSRIDIDKLQKLDTLVRWSDVSHFRTCEAYNNQLDDLDRLLTNYPDIALRGPSDEMTDDELVTRLALLSMARGLPNVPYSLRFQQTRADQFQIVRPTIPPGEIKQLDELRDAFNGLYAAYHEAFLARREAADAAGKYYLMVAPRPGPPRPPTDEYTWH